MVISYILKNGGFAEYLLSKGGYKNGFMSRFQMGFFVSSRVEILEELPNNNNNNNASVFLLRKNILIIYFASH